MKFARVENEPNLVRDTHSKAIISVDATGLEAYKMQKQARLNQNIKITRLTEDVNELKNEISEIKNLLISLLDK